MRSSPCPTTTTGSGGSNTSNFSSSSSSSSSHPPPPLTTNLTNLTSTLQIPTPRRTMEEVWKDISLTSLQDHHPHHHHHHHHHHQRSTQLKWVTPPTQPPGLPCPALHQRPFNNLHHFHRRIWRCLRLPAAARHGAVLEFQASPSSVSLPGAA
ncbi:hypothetical protein Syun_005463 [Stephania yunnanensis]|uniref:Uncharacterized protein n=1 Tax=Stephania yunnanensis TaxID=152371 RepID=A0AAP0Q5Z0_9MAGN